MISPGPSHPLAATSANARRSAAARARLSLLGAAAVLAAGLGGLAKPALSAAAGTRVGCFDYTGGNLSESLLRRPSSCHFVVVNSLEDGVYVRGMSWRGWGTSKARTSGTLVSIMNHRRRLRVTLTLYGRQSCAGYGYIYTLMKFKVARFPTRTMVLGYGNRTGINGRQIINLVKCG